MRCKKTIEGQSNQSNKVSIMKPAGKVIKNILYNMSVKCPNKDCQKVMTLEEYKEHELICDLLSCKNPKCNKKTKTYITYKENDLAQEEFIFCNDLCKYSFLFQNLAKTATTDELCEWFNTLVTKTIPETIHKDCDKRINNLKNIVREVSGETKIINENDYSPGITHFKWDNVKKGQGIQVFNNGESLFLNESCYAFRSVVSNQPFDKGVHYFEVAADRRTENEIKIGVTKNINFNYDTSFSDYDFGYAFYGIGQLRHSNNVTGEVYGKKFKKSGTLGIFLDMNKGILSFALDGEYFGPAFHCDELKTGPIYPAVSLLHVGGCKLQTGIPAPAYFFNNNDYID